jgi:TRAP-type C4-dicarboxylate transport system permease small subunit
MADAASNSDEPRPADAIGRFLTRAADAAAVLGGLVLSAMILLTVVSIVGRALAGLGRVFPAFRVFGPVPGDFEIMSMAGAVAVAAFMPLCQMRAGHVVVDLLFRGAGPRLQALFSLVGNLLFVLVGALIVLGALAGALDKRRYGETTMLVRLPAWWGHAGLTACFALAVVCALYLAVRDSRRLVAWGAER